MVRRSDGDVPGAQRTVRASELHAVLVDADVVIVAAAATGENVKLIGAAELAAGASSGRSSTVGGAARDYHLAHGWHAGDGHAAAGQRIRVNVRALMSGSGRFVGVVDPEAGY